MKTKPSTPSYMPKRALDVGQLRAFLAVAEHLSFRVAADTLFLTQSAVSRQIQALEDDIGAALFLRHTRAVELTLAGQTLRRAALPALDQIDAAVRQIRQVRGRQFVSVSTFASFASMWLIPRLHLFQALHPSIDIRVTTTDNLVPDDSPDVDLIMRYARETDVPRGAIALFVDSITVIANPKLAPALRKPADLARQTLINDEDMRPSADWRSWEHWFSAQNMSVVEPKRWLTFNYAYQQAQAAVHGQGVALARLPLVMDLLASGELVEIMPERRLPSSPFSYWLARTQTGADREPVNLFFGWVQQQAELTRRLIDAGRVVEK
jgi:LysR family transcriptional regulator, glycine cleavage system transcriptional activator